MLGFCVASLLATSGVWGGLPVYWQTLGVGHVGGTELPACWRPVICWGCWGCWGLALPACWPSQSIMCGLDCQFTGKPWALPVFWPFSPAQELKRTSSEEKGDSHPTGDHVPWPFIRMSIPIGNYYWNYAEITTCFFNKQYLVYSILWEGTRKVGRWSMTTLSVA